MAGSVKSHRLPSMPTSTQRFCVHGLKSSQSAAVVQVQVNVPTQRGSVPPSAPTHVSDSVHSLLSSHGAPTSSTSMGHDLEMPVQSSGRSQPGKVPPAPRQTTVSTFTRSVGQFLLEPSQFSPTSQNPSAARHTVVAGSFRSVGQSGPSPGQTSPMSHTPDLARHETPAAMKPSAGHDLVDPSHTSTTSHDPCEGRQGVSCALILSSHSLLT
mmetsp:Transcript_2863/g.9314  ORF Transcript_2863/g.9314 Transcript_2863/m.9314 type:complete len:212 (+) Transcript_2863:2031-2666(+)